MTLSGQTKRGDMTSGNLNLFKMALGLEDPWKVTRTDFTPQTGRDHLYLDFPRGARFSCPVDGCDQEACPVHDAEDKQWRHLDFFQHEAYMHARLPRVRCHEHGVHQVNVSWARPGSGFTLLFEALLITFATAMPVAKVGEIAREHDTRVWRVIENHVARERAKLDFAEVREVGLDETSAAKGQDHITVFMDLLLRRVLFAIEGRDASTVKAFAADLVAHGGDPELITRTSSDMSNAFLAGVGDNLPNAEMTFDRFHVMKLLSEAVDDVRRVEQRDNPLLKKTRYIWLKNEPNLTAKQKETRAWLTRPSMRLATARALRWREDFQAFYDQPQQAAEAYLRHWCYGAKRSRLEPLKHFVALVTDPWVGQLTHTLHWSLFPLAGVGVALPTGPPPPASRVLRIAAATACGRP